MHIGSNVIIWIKMKSVYLVLTHTGTSFSNLIRRHTGNTYNHISIALREDLEEMYSFGRLNPYIFFWGGFVIESPKKGTFKRFGKTIAKVLELPVTEEAYAIIENYIQQFIADKKTFGYNFLGILKARNNVNYQKSYRKFYCSQFVNYLLVCARVIPEYHFGNVVTPESFCTLENVTVRYEGLLKEYDISLFSAQNLLNS